MSYLNFFLSNQYLEVSGRFRNISFEQKSKNITFSNLRHWHDPVRYSHANILCFSLIAIFWVYFFAQIHDFQLQMGSEIPSPSWNFENFVSRCLRHWWRPSTVFLCEYMMFLIDCDLLSSVFLLRSMIFNSNWVQKYHLQAGILKISYLDGISEPISVENQELCVQNCSGIVF